MKRRITQLAMTAAWIAIIAIAYATLTNVGLVYAIYFKLSPFLMRPAMQTYAHFEHVFAFAALLEILQTMTPDRHGTLIDALEKMAGGAAGIILVRTAQRLLFAKDKPS